MSGRLWLTLAVTVALFPTACTVPPSYDLAINNVEIIDVESGASRRASIGITGETISAISRTPLNALRIIDASDLWAVPALWDMHAHIADPVYFDMFIANGVVGVRDMGGDADRAGDGCESIKVEQLAKWRNEIESGSRVGPTLVIAGPVATGSPGHGVMTVSSAETARAAVANIDERGGDFVKVYEDISLPAFEALVDEAKARSLPVAGHVSENTLTIMDALRLGQASIEHVRTPLLLCFAEDETELEAFYSADNWTEEDRFWAAPHRDACPAIFENLRRGGTWLTSTLAVENMRNRTAYARIAGDPRRARLPQAVNSAAEAFRNRMLSQDEKSAAEQQNWWKTQLAFLRRAAREGAPLLAGSDAACEGVLPGYGLHEQLALMVEAGLSPLEAIQSATIAPAAFFLKTETNGSIAIGKVADILLLRDDPLSDINALSQIEYLVLKGSMLNRLELQSLATGSEDSAD